MTRTVLLLSSLFVAACTVGEFADPSGDDTGSGSGSGTGSGSGIGSGSGNGCVQRLAPPADAYMHSDGTGTHADLDCRVGGCHLLGQLGAGAPAYQYGGTLYNGAGTAPSVGAAVVIKGGGKTATVYTDTAGNFSVMDDGTLPNPFTNGSVSVSGCPTVHAMATVLAQPGCGTKACHDPGGLGGKITLPDQ